MSRLYWLSVLSRINTWCQCEGVGCEWCCLGFRR